MGRSSFLTSRAVARVLLVAIHFYTAYIKVTDSAKMSMGLHSNLSSGPFNVVRYGIDVDGVAPLLTIGAGVLELSGALAVVLGFENVGSVMLIAFLVPVTLIMHQPLVHAGGPFPPIPQWLAAVFTEPEAALSALSELSVDASQLIQVFKNCAIIGGHVALRSSMPAVEPGSDEDDVPEWRKQHDRNQAQRRANRKEHGE